MANIGCFGGWNSTKIEIMYCTYNKTHQRKTITESLKLERITEIYAGDTGRALKM